LWGSGVGQLKLVGCEDFNLPYRITTTTAFLTVKIEIFSITEYECFDV
jgi:hypothetical protein